jgi:hypothetical protein
MSAVSPKAEVIRSISDSTTTDVTQAPNRSLASCAINSATFNGPSSSRCCRQDAAFRQRFDDLDKATLMPALCRGDEAMFTGHDARGNHLHVAPTRSDTELFSRIERWQVRSHKGRISTAGISFLLALLLGGAAFLFQQAVGEIAVGTAWASDVCSTSQLFCPHPEYLGYAAGVTLVIVVIARFLSVVS